MAYMGTLIFLLCFSVSYAKLDTLQCSNDQLQQCLISITLERRSIGAPLSTIELMSNCRNFREGLNCLIWYSVNCISQSQRGVTKDVIENVRQYLKNVCEDFEQVDENWRDRKCYMSDEMETCKEDYFKHNDYKKIDEYSCGHYFQFKRCAERILDEKCTEKYNIYLSTYLLDKADEFSWMCSEEDTYFNNRNDQLMIRSIKGARCLIRNREKLSACRRNYDENENVIESEDIFATACCAFKKYVFCIDDVATTNCRSESRELIDNALQRLNRDLNYKCINYELDMCSSCSALTSLLSLIVGMITVMEVCVRH
ncbi:uncharacterized protein LOC111632269 [Centruroides sculpturatus]|uniref:uncharacterized protein LOC111632269 n=2 Tax=Centruroides sculpturatus TaxID=218467 RepID=UPI000C6E85F9|nr:uncharacterized protein LOC111632269 [Centruroides sculpturatus]